MEPKLPLDRTHITLLLLAAVAEVPLAHLEEAEARLEGTGARLVAAGARAHEAQWNPRVRDTADPPAREVQARDVYHFVFTASGISHMCIASYIVVVVVFSHTAMKG